MPISKVPARASTSKSSSISRLFVVQVDMERTINDNLRMELNLKGPQLEDQAMEIKELKRCQMQDREQIEKSDIFISRLQGQLATQQARIDSLQEVLFSH